MSKRNAPENGKRSRRVYPEELKRAIELVKLTTFELKSDEKAWASFCQALLVTNEFRYVD